MQPTACDTNYISTLNAVAQSGAATSRGLSCGMNCIKKIVESNQLRQRSCTHAAVSSSGKKLPLKTSGQGATLDFLCQNDCSPAIKRLAKEQPQGQRCCEA